MGVRIDALGVFESRGSTSKYVPSHPWSGANRHRRHCLPRVPHT